MILIVFSVSLTCQSNKIIYYLLINNSQNHHFNTIRTTSLKIVNLTGTTNLPFYYLCYRPENGLADNPTIACHFCSHLPNLQLPQKGQNPFGSCTANISKSANHILVISSAERSTNLATSSTDIPTARSFFAISKAFDRLPCIKPSARPSA